MDEKLNVKHVFKWAKCAFYGNDYEQSAAPRSCGIQLASFFIKQLPEEKAQEIDLNKFRLKVEEKEKLEAEKAE